MQEVNELKALVVQSLEANGILGQLRAQLRASVFKIVDSQESNTKKVSSYYWENPLCQKIYELPSGPIALELITEFLQFFKMDYTLSIFQNESNFKNEVNKEKLAERLGLEPEGASNKSPILVQILNAAISGKGLGAGPKKEAQKSSALVDEARKKEQDLIFKQQQQEESKRKMDEELRKKKAEEEHQRQKDEEAALKKKQDEDNKKRLEEEANRKKAEEAEAKRKLEEKRRADEEANRKRLEEEANKKRQEEEANRKKLEEEAKKKQAEEEALRKKKEEELARNKKIEEENLRKQQEEKKKLENEALMKKKQQEEEKKRQEEEKKKQDKAKPKPGPQRGVFEDLEDDLDDDFLGMNPPHKSHDKMSDQDVDFEESDENYFNQQRNMMKNSDKNKAGVEKEKKTLAETKEKLSNYEQSLKSGKVGELSKNMRDDFGEDESGDLKGNKSIKPGHEASNASNEYENEHFEEEDVEQVEEDVFDEDEYYEGNQGKGGSNNQQQQGHPNQFTSSEEMVGVSQSQGFDMSVDSLALEDYDYVEDIEKV